MRLKVQAVVWFWSIPPPEGGRLGGGDYIEQKTLFARKLRNNLTEAEKKLWYFLRLGNLGVKFRRQVPIGKYFVDFVCLSNKLIIEIDGGQHFENVKDKERDAWLRSEGFMVLRFWNNEIIENIDGVLGKIILVLPPSRPVG